MKSHTRKIALLLLLALAGLSVAGCASTRTENGVTIEKNRSWNPLDYVPGL